jgi:membrane protein
MNYPLPTQLFSTLGFKGKDSKIVAQALWSEIVDHEILTRSAAISFYAMLAFVPLIAVIFAVSIELVQDSEVFNLHLHEVQPKTVLALEHTLHQIIPEDAYTVVLEQIKRFDSAHPVTVLSLGSIMSLWIASSLFMAVMDALNHIYAVKDKRRYWRRRAVAILMTLVQSLLLFTSLISIVAWPQILKILGLSSVDSLLLTVGHILAAFILTVISFALTFQIGPHCTQRTSWVTPGSLIGTILFLGSSYGFRGYVQNFGSYNKVYGSLGGVMVLMLWFWVSAVVLLTAAAINKVLEEVEEGLKPL